MSKAIRAKALTLAVAEAEPSKEFEQAFWRLFEPLFEQGVRPVAANEPGAEEQGNHDAQPHA